MQAVVVMLAATTLGVEYGWEVMDDGQLEYVIQIDPGLVDRLKQGMTITSRIDPRVSNVRCFRIRVGTGALPRELPPTAVGPPPAGPESAGGEFDSAGSAPTTDGTAPEGSDVETGAAAPVPPQPSDTRETAPDVHATPNDQIPDLLHDDGLTASRPLPATRSDIRDAGFEDVAVEVDPSASTAPPQPEEFRPTDPGPEWNQDNGTEGNDGDRTGGVASPAGDVPYPNDQFSPRPFEGVRNDAAERNSPPPNDADFAASGSDEIRASRHEAAPGGPSSSFGPYGTQGGDDAIETSGSWPERESAGDDNANMAHDGPPPPQEGGDVFAEARREPDTGSSEESSVLPATPRGEVDRTRSWLPSFITLLALFGSVGLNLYLGWIAWEVYRRYRDLITELQNATPAA